MSTGQHYEPIPGHDRENAFGTHLAPGAGGYGGYGDQPVGGGGQAGYLAGGGSYGNYGGGPDLGAGIGGMNAPAPHDFGGHSHASPQPQTKVQAATLMNMLTFGASVCIVFCSFLCSIILFFSFSLVDWLNMIYIGIFGLVMALVDVPLNLVGIQTAKHAIAKYINFTTRVTGKGVVFILTGCALVSTIISNIKGAFLEFLVVAMAAFAILIGICSLIIGVFKSCKLLQAQRALGGGALDRRYSEFALKYPGPTGGLDPQEFNTLCHHVAGKTWEEQDLKLIFNAVSHVPAWQKTQKSDILTINDLKVWTSGSFVLL
jgi:hypothetical protein